jgi:hypothetical protein
MNRTNQTLINIISVQCNREIFVHVVWHVMRPRDQTDQWQKRNKQLTHMKFPQSYLLPLEPLTPYLHYIYKVTFTN